MICKFTVHSKFPVPLAANFLQKGKVSSNENVLVGNLLLRGWEIGYELVDLQIIGNDLYIIENSSDTQDTEPSELISWTGNTGHFVAFAVY